MTIHGTAGLVFELVRRSNGRDEERMNHGHICCAQYLRSELQV